MVVKRKIEAVVFDLNGVIVKSILNKMEGINKVFGSCLPSTRVLPLFYPVYLKASLGEITLPELWQNLAAKISPGYAITGREDETFLGEMELKEDSVPEVLFYLKDRYKLGLLSNFVREWACMLLERFKLEGYFQKILISSEVGKRKPSPGLYHRMCDLLKVGPRESVYIADEQEDLLVPQKMGMLCIFIPGEDFSSSTGVSIRSIKELKNML